MISRTAAKPTSWPTFGPFLVLETVPWLMLAAALRLLAYRGGLLALPAMIAANVAIFLAFLLSTRRIVEAAEGQTRLGMLGIRDQLILARRVLWQIFALLLGVYIALLLIGARGVAPHALYGFDGIAFDQVTAMGRLWSAFLAAVVLLMILRADQGHTPSMLDALRELGQRWSHLAAAILAVFVFHLLLNPIQGYARWLVYLFWKTGAAPEFKQIAYFFFIFAFASFRLWATIAILTFALRTSYRAGGSVSPEAEKT